MVPDGVNLMALVSKLASTCSSLSASPLQQKMSFDAHIEEIRPLQQPCGKTLLRCVAGNSQDKMAYRYANHRLH